MVAYSSGSGAVDDEGEHEDSGKDNDDTAPDAAAFNTKLAARALVAAGYEWGFWGLGGQNLDGLERGFWGGEGDFGLELFHFAFQGALPGLKFAHLRLQGVLGFAGEKGHGWFVPEVGEGVNPGEADRCGSGFPIRAATAFRGAPGG